MKEVLPERGSGPLALKPAAEHQRLDEILKDASSEHPLYTVLKDAGRLMEDDGSNRVGACIEKAREVWSKLAAETCMRPVEQARGLNTLAWLESLLQQQLGYRKMLKVAADTKRDPDMAAALARDNALRKATGEALRDLRFYRDHGPAYSALPGEGAGRPRPLSNRR